jgi:phenylacetate-CoA ligase
MSVYSRIFESLLLPAHNRLRGRQYHVHRDFLEQSQWWPREKLEAFQWQELMALLKHAYASVPYYQRKYADAGVRLEDIRTMADFRRLPPLTRQEVNAHRPELRSRSYGGTLIPQATGGSSGVPTQFDITWESYDWRTAATERVYAWTGCRLGERALFLWGAPVGRQRRRQVLKDGLFYGLRRQRIINTFQQSEAIWAKVYQRARRYRPRLLVGYVNSLEGFAHYLLATGGRLPSSLRATIAAAEPVYQTTRELLEKAFGVPLFNTYGSREFMSLGGECERHQGMHINMENILLETAGRPEDGPSDILITDLHNYGMPFIRYAIGDLGVLDPAGCPCGRNLPLLKSVDGRVLDVFRTAGGRVVPGEFFPHVLKEIAEIKEYQVQQVALDRIVLRAVLSGEISARSRRLLDDEMKRAFGDGVRLEIERVDQIPRLASGKRRVAIGLGHPG